MSISQEEKNLLNSYSYSIEEMGSDIRTADISPGIKIQFLGKYLEILLEESRKLDLLLKEHREQMQKYM